MAVLGLVLRIGAAIHVFPAIPGNGSVDYRKAWITGTSPVMTIGEGAQAALGSTSAITRLPISRSAIASS